jgi:hypothetical protein
VVVRLATGDVVKVVKKWGDTYVYGTDASSRPHATHLSHFLGLRVF